jgi:ABC-2 type transport system ATP-binding protein
MEIALSADSIVKTFGKGSKAVHALQGVTLNVERGQIFGLLGPNGAGKTTLIKCVLGIVWTNGGRGTVLGNPFGSVKAKEHIGYLPENHRYPLHLTGEQVLSYFGKLSEVPKPVLEQRITETLALVGMSDWRKTLIRKYSKGMMQRLGLAQALLNDPELIMLDEPTDGVDPVGRKEIRDILVHLKDQGKTIFLNSHLLSEVERISDRVAIMNKGAVVREGTVSELTLTQNVFDVRVTPEFTQSASEVLSQYAAHMGEGVFEVRCNTLNEMNTMLDSLRSRGILIESINPRRSSLEDLFIKMIGGTGEVEHR